VALPLPSEAAGNSAGAQFVPEGGTIRYVPAGFMGDGGFEALYRTHAPAVFRRARRLLGSESDAHEIVQEVFLSLLERPEQFGARSALTTFLYAATTHACLNRLRNQRTRARLLSEHAQERSLPEAQAWTQEETLMLRRALAELPDETARALAYYCVDGLSHEEIARLLGCSRRHVGDLLARANAWGKASEEGAC
jgi:RNA polymerase sigma factor (sigma-70 family)